MFKRTVVLTAKGHAWLPLLALPCLAGRQSAGEIFHPGHTAEHVTRLHRYEQEGMASFLEADALPKPSKLQKLGMVILLL